MNLYEILGIEPDATEEQIVKAKRKAAKKHHPDRGGSHERMSEVNKAYDILMDAEARKRYDETGSTENVPDVDASAINLLRQILTDIFTNARISERVNLVAHLRKVVDDGHQQLRAKLKQTEAQIELIDHRLEKLSSKNAKATVIELTRAVKGELEHLKLNVNRTLMAIERAQEFINETTDSTIETPGGSAARDSLLQSLISQWGQR